MPVLEQYQTPPSANQFSIALKALAEVEANLVAVRAKNAGIGWIQEAMQNFPAAINESYGADEPVFEIEPFDDPASAAALNFLLNEIWALTSRFRELASEETQHLIDQNTQDLPGIVFATPEDYLTDRAVDDFETVTGSVEKLMKKLPKWLQRVLDVLLEALKLTRGVI